MPHLSAHLHLVLDVPADARTPAELLDLVGTLHDLALDLLPDASATTDVVLGGSRP